MSVHQKILIVDDRENNLVALEKTLNEIGAEIVKALSGDEALRASLNHDFALAILDAQMPNMDGYELAEFLRDDEKTRHLPIIFLTAAFTHETDAFRGYKAGAVDYLTKPCDPIVLFHKVKVFLELDRQRAELLRQRVLLEAANNELDAFAHSVSHDLRAPLLSLDGFIHVLMEGHAAKLDGEAKYCLDRISKASRRMGQMIDDILTLARAARQDIQTEHVNLSALAQELLAELSKRDPDRGVTIAIAPNVTARGDSRLLQVVLDNLLGNAWKFTGKKDAAKIEFGVHSKDREQVYFVRDDGVGFDMAYADKLFGTFQRLHSTTEFEGTGIGLATVARLVRRHGGRVWAEGEVNKGASFYFTLGS